MNFPPIGEADRSNQADTEGMRRFRAGAVVFVTACVAAIVLGVYFAAVFPLRSNPQGPGIYLIISLGAVGAVGALFCLVTGVRTMRGPRRR